MMREYHITYNKKQYELHVERQGGEIKISHDGNHYSVTVEEAHTEIAAATPAPVAATPIAPAVAPPTPMPASGNAGSTVAPMTGVIKTIHTAIGDTVKTGQLVITMEAMKMDIPVNAATDGEIAEIKVAVGDSVQQNTPLISVGKAK